MKNVLYLFGARPDLPVDEFISNTKFKMKKVNLPENLIKKAVNLPENGMGYQLMLLNLKNGGQIIAKVINSSFFLTDQDITTEDILDLNLIK